MLFDAGALDLEAGIFPMLWLVCGDLWWFLLLKLKAVMMKREEERLGQSDVVMTESQTVQPVFVSHVGWYCFSVCNN